MNQTDYQHVFKNFTVLKNNFDRFLFRQGPLLLLVQFGITILVFLLASPNPFGPRYTLRWEEAVFFLFGLIVLVVELYVTRDFFENIPRTFQDLVERKVIKGLGKDRLVNLKLSTFVREFEDRLNGRGPLVIGCILEVLILIANQRAMLFPIIFLPKDYPVFALIINFLTLFMPLTIAGYAIGVVIWKCFVTGYFVHRFSTLFDIAISPSHPDKSGGLKPLGDLIFSLALILIVASLAFSILTVANQINAAIYQVLVSLYSPKYQIVAPYLLYTTVWVAKVSLGIVLILSFVSFLLPLTSAHRRMRSEKESLLSGLTGVGNKIAELEKRAKQLNLDYKVRNDIFEEINSLSKIYDRTYKAPVWPFDRDILIKFFTPQVISILSLFGVVQPIIDALASWLK
jgi:hypothetical protein